MNEWSSPTSHRVTTRLRSMPFGRAGAGGTSPLAMRSVPVGVCFHRSSFALVPRTPLHRFAAPAGPQPPLPRLGVRLQLRLRLLHIVDGAGELIAELVTEVAVRFQRIDPVILRE